MEHEIGTGCSQVDCFRHVHIPCSSCGRFQAGLTVGPPRLMNPAEREAIPYGVRELVVWLNAKGFETRANREAPPVIQIVVAPEDLIEHTDSLVAYLTAKGVQYPGQNLISTYDPEVPTAEILVVGLDSSCLLNS